MKNQLCLSLVLLAMNASQTFAQSLYTPYTFTTLAGLAGSGGSTDGTGSAARFNRPHGVAADTAGNVYVADSYNHTIRKVTAAGVVTTLAGNASITNSDGYPFGGYADGTGSAAQFEGPRGVAVDSAGNVYVADTYNYTIRKISPSGDVTTLAGLAGSSGSADGTGSDARFGRRYTQIPYYGPEGVAVDSAGNLYVADTGNSTIRKVTPIGTNWVVTTLAGLAGSGGSADGMNSDARFNRPSGVAVDSAGGVYVADYYNDSIRKVTLLGTNWIVTTLAGLTENSGSADGTGSAAQFRIPHGVAVDSAGNVYVADKGNYTIRKVTPSGVVTTLAGLAGSLGCTDGTGSDARFGGIYDGSEGVAVDNAGNVYVADTGNNTIRKGTPLLQFESNTGSLAVANGFFQLRLIGPFSSNAVMEESVNLQTWTPIQTNTLLPGGLDMSVPVDTNQNQFFRARLSP